MFTCCAAKKRQTRPALILTVLLALPAASLPRMASAAPTTLTETGQLVIAGVPANGSYDFQFSLFTAASGGSQLGSTVTVLNVPVTNGVFYAEINFGTAFAGGVTSYVQTAYRTAGAGVYSIQTPRHQAPNSAFADYASLSGTTVGLQSKGVSKTAPLTGQALVYTGTLWTPTTLPAAPAYTAGAGLALSGVKFSIPTGGVTASMLAAGSVGTSAITVPLALTGTSSTVLSGTNTSVAGAGISGRNAFIGDSGLLGGTDPISGSAIPVGVFGNDVAPSGIGVFGNSDAGYGVVGNSISSAAGVLGISSGGGLDENGTGSGIEGITGSGKGVFGYSTSGDGVYGATNTGIGGDFTSGGTDGVRGESTASGGNGIVGVANSGADAYGLYGISTSGFAGFFDGKVNVSGDLNVTGAITAGTKDFKIDDPLDPAGKFLSLACIESDQMADLYSGNAVTDAQGSAVVTLPAWFQALNKDFRYVLTAVGAPGPNLYIAQKVKDNRFQIAGGQPGAEVSWQVTGIRHDAYAVAHPLQVEEDKPEAEQGLFLHPKEQGQPEEQGIAYQQSQAHEAHAPKRP